MILGLLFVVLFVAGFAAGAVLFFLAERGSRRFRRRTHPLSAPLPEEGEEEEEGEPFSGSPGLPDPEWHWVQENNYASRALVELACTWVRRIWEQLPDAARGILEIAERYAQGAVEAEEMRKTARHLFLSLDTKEMESGPVMAAIWAAHPPSAHDLDGPFDAAHVVARYVAEVLGDPVTREGMLGELVGVKRGISARWVNERSPSLRLTPRPAPTRPGGCCGDGHVK